MGGTRVQFGDFVFLLLCVRLCLHVEKMLRVELFESESGFLIKRGLTQCLVRIEEERSSHS